MYYYYRTNFEVKSNPTRLQKLDFKTGFAINNCCGGKFFNQLFL